MKLFSCGKKTIEGMGSIGVGRQTTAIAPTPETQNMGDGLAIA